ncbi:MAG: sortase [Patescibacteria group bacterium]
MKSFTEQDLENIFAGKKNKNPRRSLYALYIILTIFLAAGVFLLINGPAVLTKINYWYKSDISQGTSENPGVTSSGTTTNDNNASGSRSGTISISDNTIYVQRIGINAPITWDVVNSPDTTSKALENGTIHLAGTADPGEIGNIFITGHSSNYLWAPGKYKSIFATLNRVVVGDKIFIKYQSRLFTYTVSKIFITKPDDLSVLNQGKDSILTLVTCTPVGTSINRLVIVASQTNPDPALNNINKNKTDSQTLPYAR